MQSDKKNDIFYAEEQILEDLSRLFLGNKECKPEDNGATSLEHYKKKKSTKILYPGEISFSNVANVRLLRHKKVERNYYYITCIIRNAKGSSSSKWKIIPEGNLHPRLKNS